MTVVVAEIFTKATLKERCTMFLSNYGERFTDILMPLSDELEETCHSRFVTSAGSGISRLWWFTATDTLDPSAHL
jgi:hypothetical protein